MSDLITKSVPLPEGFRVAITWKPAQEELKLQVLDANDTEYDVVRINVRKKAELDRSAFSDLYAFTGPKSGYKPKL